MSEYIHRMSLVVPELMMAQGDLMSGRNYGFIWLSRTPIDSERYKANEYLAQKSGVTL